jgi:sortase A
VIRRLGTVAVFVGLGLLAWSGTVYVWKDPFTTAYTAFQQRRLEEDLSERFKAWRPVLPAGTKPQSGQPNLRREARAFDLASEPGDAIARLEVPRLDLDVVVVNGTDVGSLRRGPGRHLETAMPGEGELVYIAGHRTTFGAPFSNIDKLRRGDRISLEMPYGSVVYAVTSHRIVSQHEVSVLKSSGREELVLQACHPRFFASQRYLVYARPVRILGRRRSATETPQLGVTR